MRNIDFYEFERPYLLIPEPDNSHLLLIYFLHEEIEDLLYFTHLRFHVRKNNPELIMKVHHYAPVSNTELHSDIVPIDHDGSIPLSTKAELLLQGYSYMPETSGMLSPELFDHPPFDDFISEDKFYELYESNEEEWVLRYTTYGTDCEGYRRFVAFGEGPLPFEKV